MFCLAALLNGLRAIHPGSEILIKQIAADIAPRNQFPHTHDLTAKLSGQPNRRNLSRHFIEVEVMRTESIVRPVRYIDIPSRVVGKPLKKVIINPNNLMGLTQ